MHSAHQVTVTHNYRRSASRLTIFAHVFGVLAFILMLVWLLHYREGIEYDSYNGYRVFNASSSISYVLWIHIPLRRSDDGVQDSKCDTHGPEGGPYDVSAWGICAGTVVGRVDFVYGSSTGGDKAQPTSVAHLRWPDVAIYVDSGGADRVDGKSYVPATAKIGFNIASIDQYGSLFVIMLICSALDHRMNLDMQFVFSDSFLTMLDNDSRFSVVFQSIDPML
ncbi:hypothetical protein F3Y22_tig00111220pilonHSYRG00021 [Hibiscus syriacus]|uniref:Uncharacterized protein n=1 Tax=Hibiscus syriacus TaxID=106335 RepID=A0A6A2YUC1_HIBSY|nr:hypothetical protein F3Y22_tig00111220pilonHSYRG00021 [Hibiscus syriacus]